MGWGGCNHTKTTVEAMLQLSPLTTMPSAGRRTVKEGRKEGAIVSEWGSDGLARCVPHFYSFSRACLHVPVRWFVHFRTLSQPASLPICLHISFSLSFFLSVYVSPIVTQNTIREIHSFGGHSQGWIYCQCTQQNNPHVAITLITSITQN